MVAGHWIRTQYLPAYSYWDNRYDPVNGHILFLYVDKRKKRTATPPYHPSSAPVLMSSKYIYNKPVTDKN